MSNFVHDECLRFLRNAENIRISQNEDTFGL